MKEKGTKKRKLRRAGAQSSGPLTWEEKSEERNELDKWEKP